MQTLAQRRRLNRASTKVPEIKERPQPGIKPRPSRYLPPKRSEQHQSPDDKSGSPEHGNKPVRHGRSPLGINHCHGDVEGRAAMEEAQPQTVQIPSANKPFPADLRTDALGHQRIL